MELFSIKLQHKLISLNSKGWLWIMATDWKSAHVQAVVKMWNCIRKRVLQIPISAKPQRILSSGYTDHKLLNPIISAACKVSPHNQFCP